MFDRDYSAQEIWANYAYFLDAVLPVAEKGASSWLTTRTILQSLP
jgi:hypothetical protein